jgi:acyl-CoA thioesterase FadM
VRVPDLMPNSVLISNEWEFRRPLRVGDALTARSRLADISERFGGQFGYGLYIRTEVELRDMTGELVARTATTLMQYDAANARTDER